MGADGEVKARLRFPTCVLLLCLQCKRAVLTYNHSGIKLRRTGLDLSAWRSIAALFFLTGMIWRGISY